MDHVPQVGCFRTSSHCFHRLTVYIRRHADRTVQIWHQRLKDLSSHKRLNLIYLANGKDPCSLFRSPTTDELILTCRKCVEVCQQSKVRHKEDFLVAFSPVIAEATATAYKGAPSDIQTRIRRVVDVWKERHVFEEPIQTAIETRLEGKPYTMNLLVSMLTIEQNSKRPRAPPSLALAEPYLVHRHLCHPSCLH